VYNHTQNELNVVNLIKTIHKIKAGLAAVIASNKDYLHVAKALYFQDCTAYHFDNCEKEYEAKNLENRRKKLLKTY